MWLGLKASARYVGVSEALVRKGIADGDLKAYRRPGSDSSHAKVLINSDDLDAWVRSFPEYKARVMC